MLYNGDFSKSMVTDVPADLSSETYKKLKEKITRFPEEAIYIYSFKEEKMVFAEGFEEVLGYKDDEISMRTILSITTKEYAPFANDLNDNAILFILQKKEELEKYSFTIELKKYHKNGSEIPLIVRVGVFSSYDGKVMEIIGRSQINKSITLGKVMKYAAYGPEKSEFEEQLSKDLFKHFAISRKEKEAIELISKGFSLKEISSHLSISQSAVEKRVLPLYKRFEVKSNSHLVKFAIENHII